MIYLSRQSLLSERSRAQPDFNLFQGKVVLQVAIRQAPALCRANPERIHAPNCGGGSGGLAAPSPGNPPTFP